MKLQNRVALITGASRGIGRAVALAYAREGAELILCARHTGSLQAVAAEAQGLGRQALTVQADVAVASDVEAMVEQAIARFNRVDILCNNAGILLHYPLVEHPLDQWAQTMAINVTGTLLCCQAVLPHMVRQGYGRIINMSSILSVLCLPGYGAYSASKAAVNALTKTLAREFADYNILINGQHPGNIKTDLNPGGLYTPDHAVPTAVYLASLPDGGPTGKVFYDMKEVDWRV